MNLGVDYLYLHDGICATNLSQNVPPLNGSHQRDNSDACYSLCQNTTNCGYFAYCDIGFGCEKQCNLYDKFTNVTSGVDHSGMKCYKLNTNQFDMDLSEEQWKNLMGEPMYEDIQDGDYLESDNVRPEHDKWKWSPKDNAGVTNIPYQIDNNFPDPYKDQILEVIAEINSLLSGCIKFR